MGVAIIENREKELICREKLNRFVEENRYFLEHRVVKSFLSNEENKRLFFEVICYPTSVNKKKLDEEFKRFYFNIRFTAFLSSTLYFNAINYDKRHRKLSNRYQLTLDQSIGDEEEERTFKDLIEDSNSNLTIDDILDSTDIKDYVTEPSLVQAINKLTPKQKEVIDLAYVKGLSDTEIAKRLGKSQQGISKLHKKALKRIHDSIEENGFDLNDS